MIGPPHYFLRQIVNYGFMTTKSQPTSINMASPFPSKRRKNGCQFSSFSSLFTEESGRNQTKNNDVIHGGDLNLPDGPVFFATQEDFERSPVDFINKIRPHAQKYGICKIVPPAGWNPPFALNMETKKKFPTKEQHLHRIQEGVSFGDGEEYTPSDYLRHAHEHVKAWYDENYAESSKPMTPLSIERDYWDIIESGNREYFVEYGNDVDTQSFGSGFPRSERGRCLGGEIDVEKFHSPEPAFGTDDYYKETYWNLNNIPQCDESVLRHVKVGINGINVPWLYFGGIFTTFCYHTEDNDFYSINYHHYGAPKLWYGVPGNVKDAEGMEKVFKGVMSSKMREVPELIYHITTMFSPRLMQKADVPVFRVIQHPGEFVLTFPRSFHGGFSLGPNVGEAVNFATHDWIPFGAAANERYRKYARPAVFSHDRLAFTMAFHLKEQRTYENCLLLAQELKRIYEEEIHLRNELVDSGVRDVSEKLPLPRNRLDKIDEQSADYDEKRLCHACKHICFFSCVACQCSQSKVSCLRHSKFMCRCPSHRKYLMIWSTEDEMKKTLTAVENWAEDLKYQQDPSIFSANSNDREEDEGIIVPSPGSQRDAKIHRGYFVDLSPSSPILLLPGTNTRPLEIFQIRQQVDENELSEFEKDLKRRKIEIIEID